MENKGSPFFFNLNASYKYRIFDCTFALRCTGMTMMAGSTHDEFVIVVSDWVMKDEQVREMVRTVGPSHWNK